MNKGNILVIVVILVSLGLIGGFYLKSNGKINLPINIQTISENPNITSDLISLSVSSDKNGLITGHTSAFAEVFINDQITKADKNGDFSLKLDLDEGENSVIVTVNDSDGNVAEQSLDINIE